MPVRRRGLDTIGLDALAWFLWYGGKVHRSLCVCLPWDHGRVWRCHLAYGFIFGLFWTAGLGTAENGALTIDGIGRSVSTV